MNKYSPEQIDLKNLVSYKVSDVRKAIEDGDILESMVIKCSPELELEVSMGNHIIGKIPFSELEYTVDDKPVKSVHATTKVGKTIKYKVKSMKKVDNCYYCELSRKDAQKECIDNYISKLFVGQIIDAVAIHVEKYGIFCDIGCGITALLPTKNVSIVKFKDPVLELRGVRRLKAVVQSIEDGKVTLSHKELLGTWEEEVSKFQLNEVVTGIVRLVTDYGVFVELTPNLLGLAEVYPDVAINDVVSVFIRGFVPDSMKVKLMITGVTGQKTGKTYYSYKLPSCGFVKDWVYNTPNAPKKTESHFNVPEEKLREAEEMQENQKFENNDN